MSLTPKLECNPERISSPQLSVIGAGKESLRISDKSQRVQSALLASILPVNLSFGAVMSVKVQLRYLSFNSMFCNVYEWERILGSIEMFTIITLSVCSAYVFM